MSESKRLIDLIPGGGAFFQGRLGMIDTVWHLDEPPAGLRSIDDLIRWMCRIERCVEWLSELLTVEQTPKEN